MSVQRYTESINLETAPGESILSPGERKRADSATHSKTVGLFGSFFCAFREQQTLRPAIYVFEQLKNAPDRRKSERFRLFPSQH